MDVNFQVLATAPLQLDPFPYTLAHNFLGPAALSAIDRDFPDIDMAGLFPPDQLANGPAIAELIEVLEGDQLRRILSEKFAVDLGGRPAMVTFRANARPRDGQIHRDSPFKILSLLLYLNRDWADSGGRLRLLRSPTDLEDFVVEVPPQGGTLVAFRCTDNAWHGHRPFAGRRRGVMVNYCVDDRVWRSELRRHRLSARLKKVKRLLGIGAVTSP